MHELILRNARLEDSIVDIGVSNGKIAEIAPKISGTGQTEINAEGCMVSSPFIESHVHLDTTLTAGEPKWNESGTLFEGIETWALRKKALTHEDVALRASTLLKWQAAQGVLHVRSHVDVTDPEMTALKALLEVKEKFKDLVNVQIVAFPQEGILSYPNGTELLEEALKMGADAVGAIPHYELTRDMGAESIKIVFKLAEKYNKLIDIHCDETDDPQSRFLEIVVAEAIRTGMGKLVTASHTTAFGSYDNAYAFKLMSFIKKADINFVSNPLVNITLQGRLDTYPKRRGVTRVKELWQNGINVSFGYDDIMDPWYSMGTGNMLQPAHMGVHVCQMTGRSQVMACYDMITKNAARTLNIEENYGIETGKPADFIVLDAKDKWEAIRRLAAVTLVIKNGQVIAETNAPKTKLLGETIKFSK
ncbi:MAG: cytosine deaminase [Bacillota bacterium]|nr:cytosine deaminase [Bacillota bacterium]